MQYGLIGERLSHSLSPQIHALFSDYDYSLCELAPSELGSFMQKRDFRGVNVTVPYKEAVIPYLDKLDETAQSVGAVNTVINYDGALTGYNTDVYGMKALISRVISDLSDKTVLILGSGGAAKAARAAAKALGAAKAVTVGRKARENVTDYVSMYREYKDAPAVIINATPVGMYPDTDAICVDLTKFTRLCAVIDAVYNPLRTNLVLAAQKLFAPAAGGLYMLVCQAAKACELFSGISISDEAVERAYKDILRQSENIFLIGMPGCGKTSVGKRLSEFTGRQFIDLDEMIVLREGKSIPEIFGEGGEELFRKIESRVLGGICLKARGAVVATGGGAVLKKENVRAMKRCGRLVFIDRDINLIKPADDRPLSNTKAALEEMYKARRPVYLSVCDEKVTSRATVGETAIEIMNNVQ